MSESKESMQWTSDPRKLKTVIFVLCVIIAALCLAFIITVILINQDSTAETCSSSEDTINLEPPEVLPPFHDLTKEEIVSVKRFLYSDKNLNLVKPHQLRGDRSYIFTMELHIPDKTETLNFLDNRGRVPVREAAVVINRGDKSEPIVQEFIVGPLPNPKYKRSERQRPFIHRPLDFLEYIGAVNHLKSRLASGYSYILQESFDGNLLDDNCTERCLDFQMMTPMSSPTTGEREKRMMWFWLAPVVEYWSLHPVDFMVLVDLTSSRIDEYTIKKVYYGGQAFDSLADLKQAYDSGSVVKARKKFPTMSKDLYSTMNRRGTLFPDNHLPPPREYEPRGKRYSINGRHIKYMGWDFDVQMSTAFGPRVFDIRYNNERIIYELSLQEIAVYYSGNSPGQQYADYLDSFGLIGSRVRSLVPGADCPDHSTFLSTDIVLPYITESFHVDRAFCVFEHNTGVPLRRHLAFQDHHKFYEGMMDIVLVVRTISTISNYDYIIDFIYHQNGAVEVKILSTGYILTSFLNTVDDRYGFRLRDHVVGNIHHHLFNFKVDLDIKGQSNRFEKLEIVPDTVDNPFSAKNGTKYTQTKMVRQEMKSELDAALKFNFDKPNYLIFHNKNVVTPTGVPRAYRLLTRGISKQVIEEGTGTEVIIPWARYQVAVTKRKEEERQSSSVYASYDVANPVVNFQSFIDDNESISDQDQVAWVTMGIHHIPHMEDFPVTPTVGLDLGFFLLPYNYFDEDPAMGSGDAIRIEPRDEKDIAKGLSVETYGAFHDTTCVPKQSTFIKYIKETPYSLFNP